MVRGFGGYGGLLYMNKRDFPSLDRVLCAFDLPNPPRADTQSENSGGRRHRLHGVY
jgi:hypothetical protein